MAPRTPDRQLEKATITKNGVWGRQLSEPLARRVLPAPKAFGYFSIMKSNAGPARASLEWLWTLISVEMAK